MARFSDKVGIRLEQKGGGTLRRVGASGSAESEPFSFDLHLENPSLRSFLAGPHRVERVGGCVVWTVRGQRHELPITGGRMELFRPVPNTVRTRTFDVDFVFTGPDAQELHFSAQKVLHDDRGMDLAEAGEDLSRLRNLAVRSADGALLFTGDMSVSLEQTLEEMAALSFPGAASEEEERAAGNDFAELYNGYLAELYDAVPLLFARGRYLSWTERQLLLLAARSVLPPDSKVHPQAIVLGLDRYLSRAKVPVLERVRPLLPLFAPAGLLALLGQLIPGRLIRGHVKKALEGEPGLVRDAAEFLHTLVMTPYYANPKVDAELGYVRPKLPPPGARPAPLPTHERPERIVYDVLIAGSGPAGSLLAARLTAAGKRVLLLEAGRQHPAAELDGHELDSLGGMYKEGGLQQARDTVAQKDFPVLQGWGLGGSATVNNAVNFQLPDDVLRHWQTRWDFPFTREQLRKAYAAVAGELHIVEASRALAAGARTNPAHEYLTRGLGRPVQECHVNVAGCVGCGYCVLGCSTGAKQDPVTVHLRQAVATGRLTIVTRAQVLELVTEGRRVSHARVRLGGEDVATRVSARHYVLACGPIGSSRVLHETEGFLAEARALVGKRLSANVGSPAHAFTRSPVDSARTLSLAHSYQPAGATDFLVETWFNPPASHANAMPGFLDEHLARMRRYNRLLSTGTLVGTTPEGEVRPDGRIVLPVQPRVREALARGLRATAEAFLHRDNAREVEEVVVRTRQGTSFKSLADVAAHFPAPEALLVGTGHPQGGNPLSASVRHGVVDEHFRIRGLENASVCDGSVFPDCARVNPQWTILAMAHLCAEHLARVL